MKGDTVGGWSWWIASLRSANPTMIMDYRELMKLYITGVKWEDVK